MIDELEQRLPDHVLGRRGGRRRSVRDRPGTVDRAGRRRGGAPLGGAAHLRRLDAGGHAARVGNIARQFQPIRTSTRADLATSPARGGCHYRQSRPRPETGALWYVSAMPCASVRRAHRRLRGRDRHGSRSHAVNPAEHVAHRCATAPNGASRARQAPVGDHAPQHSTGRCPPVGFDDDGYPHTDEAPVDNSNHNVATNYLRSALAERYSTRSDATVHAALGLFFKEGNRGALVVPDVFVAFGVDAGHRWSYKLWERAEAARRRRGGAFGAELPQGPARQAEPLRGAGHR